ncbi:MAG: cysteine--tRNA ligase [Defluviicoccus sp.]|nr:cysteine--tRNA ligase [Defluviicoccus sp.]MDE0274634.1 cysteine--tRNA ligase [Defluviicoccus sp.]
MAISLYNTLSRSKEPFEPIDPGNVRLYVCGPTVYDFAHIGNARPVVAFDVLYRLLRHVHGEGCVTYVRNITDVDDKIIEAARQAGEPIDTVTARYTKVFHADMAALGALPPDVEPRATDHIAEMIAMIERLVEKGHAYAAEGHVLFSVATMAEYGRLSRHGRDELIAGARVEIAPYKRDPADFVLWKPSDADQPGWDSPWGRGRPGWHLECSAMSKKHLGETFDIHGGGQDLIFPHHENEIAQSTCAHGKTFVNLWMHNGYVTVDGEKMSKSLGNFHTVHDLLERAPGEAIRLSLLTAQYRQPLDFSLEGLDRARSALDRLYTALAGARDVAASDDPAAAGPVVEALSDDLNTPRALAEMHALAGTLNRSDSADGRARAKAGLLFAGGLTGLLAQDPESWFKGAGDDGEEAIEVLVAARSRARSERDFAEADRIRDELMEIHNVVVEDRPDGSSEWRRA